MITSVIPVGVTVPAWLNDNDLIPTASKVTVSVPITISTLTTITVINTNPSTTGANTEFNALSRRRTGTQQRNCRNYN